MAHVQIRAEVGHTPNRARHQGIPLRVGTGLVMGTKFSLTGATPLEAFACNFETGAEASLTIPRWVRSACDRHEVLLFVAGAAVQAAPGSRWHTGCGVVYCPDHGDCPYFHLPEDRPRTDHDDPDLAAGPPARHGAFSFQMERRGPDGNLVARRSIARAYLRAALAALRFRSWAGEGFTRVVIASDCPNLVHGASGEVAKWARLGWRTKGGPLGNLDMWQALMGEIETLYEEGVEVAFWFVPKMHNGEAIHYAQRAAMCERKEFLTDCVGLWV